MFPPVNVVMATTTVEMKAMRGIVVSIFSFLPNALHRTAKHIIERQTFHFVQDTQHITFAQDNSKQIPLHRNSTHHPTLHKTRSHNRGRRPQARGPSKTIEKHKCAIFSENCATLNVINSRGYTHICVGLGDSLQARLRLDSRTRHMLSTNALINPSK